MDYQQRYNIIHRSLNEVKMLGGVEKRLALINWTMVMALGFYYRSFIIVLVGVATHSILRYFTRKEALIVDIYKQRNRQYNTYDPWPHVNQKVNVRPLGYGRKHLC